MSNATETLEGVLLDADGKPIFDEDRDAKVRRKLLPKLLRVARRVPFASDAAAAYFAALDPATPRHVKAVLFGALAYFLLPFDAVPDLLPGLGFLDDASIIASALAMVGSHITEVHRARAAALLDDPEDAKATPK